MRTRVLVAETSRDRFGSRWIECAEHPVPKRNDVAEIAVVIGPCPCMVQDVQARRYQQPLGAAGQAIRQADRRMLPEVRDQKHRLDSGDDYRRRTKQDHGCCCKCCRGQCFEWMVAQCGGAIDHGIGVVDLVDPPQPLPDMEQSVQPIGRETSHQQQCRESERNVPASEQPRP